MNEYYKELRSIEAPALVKEFAETAPEQVQFAVKMTVASLLGNLPAVVAEQSIMTTGKNLATLMFNMQMSTLLPSEAQTVHTLCACPAATLWLAARCCCPPDHRGRILSAPVLPHRPLKCGPKFALSRGTAGYMFRNAEYRKSLVNSLDQSLGSSEKATGALPPVSGTVTVKIADGFPAAEVDAAAYMSELRSEVEGLRAELAKVKGADGPDAEGEAALIQYIQNLDRKDQQELTQDVSPDVLEAMSQLVATILIDFNLEREQELAAPSDKVRELLITQLVTGYKLRELEVKEELKDKFWGADGKGAQ